MPASWEDIISSDLAIWKELDLLGEVKSPASTALGWEREVMMLR